MTEKIEWYSNGINTWKDVWKAACEKFGYESKQAQQSFETLKYYSNKLNDLLNKIK